MRCKILAGVAAYAEKSLLRLHQVKFIMLGILL